MEDFTICYYFTDRDIVKISWDVIFSSFRIQVNYFKMEGRGDIKQVWVKKSSSYAALLNPKTKKKGKRKVQKKCRETFSLFEINIFNSVLYNSLDREKSLTFGRIESLDWHLEELKA